MRRRTGFTLVELLAVIGIIGILMMLISPQIGQAIARARETACRNNMSMFLRAAMAFASDNNGLMASAWSRGPQATNDWQMCFIGQELFPTGVTVSSEWPQGKMGSLLNYLGGGDTVRRLSRCPGLRPGPLRSGTGSNGYFDYAMFEIFAGAKQSRMPTRARVDLGRGLEDVPCPWFVEEDPAEFLNAGYIQPFHKSTDRLGAWHRGGGNIGTPEGAVVAIGPGRKTGGVFKNPRSQDWRARAPSGTEVQLYNSAVAGPTGWGWWNRQ